VRTATRTHKYFSNFDLLRKAFFDRPADVIGPGHGERIAGKGEELNEKKGEGIYCQLQI